MCKAKDIISTLVEQSEKANKEYTTTCQRLKEVENTMLDVEHFIENETFSTVDGYYLAKALKELRIERRTLKNEKEVLKILTDTLNKTINIDFLKSAQNKINSRWGQLNQLKRDKVYIPRQLDSLDKENIINYCKAI